MPTVSILWQNANVSFLRKLDGQNFNISAFKRSLYVYTRKEINKKRERERVRGRKDELNEDEFNIRNRATLRAFYLYLVICWYGSLSISLTTFNVLVVKTYNISYKITNSHQYRYHATICLLVYDTILLYWKSCLNNIA